MKFYKAVCSKHKWESSGLYKNKSSAIRSAQAHRAKVKGPHNIQIIEVNISPGNIKTLSQTSI